MRIGHPRGQRHGRHRAARRNVIRDPTRDALPARLLPHLERPALPAEAPADREVEIARAVRDLAQVRGAIMKRVAVYRPQKLRLRVLGGMELLEALRDV